MGKAFLWIGAILCLASLGGFLKGEIADACIFLLIGIVLILISRLASKKKGNDIVKFENSKGRNDNSPKVIVDKVELKKDNENSKELLFGQYIPDQVSRAIFQALESFQLMETTRNFDTLAGRYHFISEKLYNFLKCASENHRYSSEVYSTIDRYKTLYYDRIPSQTQIEAVLKPKEFNLSEFYCHCITNTFDKYYSDQNKQISSLKRADAIKNHKKKILEVLKEILNEIPVSSSSYKTLSKRFSEIYSQVEQEVNFNSEQVLSEPQVSDEDLFGTEKFSDDKKFRVVYHTGYTNNGKWEKGVVVLFKEGKPVFKKYVDVPGDCEVSNSGHVICCDWTPSSELNGVARVFRSNGEEIFTHKVTANLGDCAISNDGSFCVFETYSSPTDDADKIFIVDIQSKTVISSTPRMVPFNDIKIDYLNKKILFVKQSGIVFETDFSGNQVNKEEYKKQLFIKGSINERLIYFDSFEFKDLVNDELYLQTLLAGTNDPETTKDYIYRTLGEVYESRQDKANALTYWEKALEINPKIGIKRKYEALKKAAN